MLLTDLNRVSLGGGYNMVSFWQLLQLLYYRVCWGGNYGIILAIIEASILIFLSGGENTHPLVVELQEGIKACELVGLRFKASSTAGLRHVHTLTPKP